MWNFNCLPLPSEWLNGAHNNLSENSLSCPLPLQALTSKGSHVLQDGLSCVHALHQVFQGTRETSVSQLRGPQTQCARALSFSQTQFSSGAILPCWMGVCAGGCLKLCQKRVVRAHGVLFGGMLCGLGTHLQWTLTSGAPVRQVLFCDSPLEHW